MKKMEELGLFIVIPLAAAVVALIITRDKGE